jgi:hypothetical protein
MKIIFYTTDTNLETVLSAFEGEQAVLCDNRNDLDKLISEFQPCIVLFDFDSSELNCRETSKDYITRGNAHCVLLTGSLKLEEIVKIQNSNFSLDAYLTKPISKQIILDIVSDIEIAIASEVTQEAVIDQPTELDESLVFNVEDLDGGEKQSLDSNDTDIEQVLEQEKDLVNEIADDDDEEEIDFNASELKVATEVREVINEHNQVSADFDDEVNQDIQRKFDQVFGKKIQEVEAPSDFSITPEQTIESEAISFDAEDTIDELETNEDSVVGSEVVEEISSNEVSMSDDKDDVGGLEFNIPDEVDESESTDEGLDFSLDENSSEEKKGDSSEGDELSFDVSTDDELDLSSSDVPVAETIEESENDGLVFDTDEGASLDLSDGESEEVSTPATEEISDDGALEFSVDDTEDLALGGDDTDHAPIAIEEESDDGLDLGDSSGELNLSTGDDEPVSAVIDDTSDDGLDLGSDDLGLSLSGEGDEIDNTSLEESDDGLDFSDSSSDETEETEGVDHASIESTDSFQLGESDDIDATINSIVAPPEDSTGEFDMSEVEQSAQVEESEADMQEFDYKTSSGFSPDLGADEVSSDVEENTNPTIISQTGALKEGDLLTDIEEDSDTVTEDIVSSELSFSETIENENLLADLKEEASDDATVTQTVQTGSISFEDGLAAEAPVTAQPQAPSMSAKEEYESFRNYDEDEMLRLQGTIRQLREEREELMGQINQLKSEKQLLEQDNLGVKAELDEVKIELGIVKKRHHDEISDKEYHYKMNQDKKDLYENKAKSLQKDFDRLNQKVRIDFNQVKQREKELESKLELTVMDSESQVQTRDLKILELKRKIDSLEFNMENSSIREQKHREDKSKLEERLGKIMKTLRGSIQLIEDDLDELETTNTKELE